MSPSPLIPLPDAIPAPPWVFHVLDIALFTAHILVINILLGGVLLFAYSRLFGRNREYLDPLAGKLPVTFALGINLGVAPLLFLQVIWGHLFYASSVLMALFWILVIPAVILAYYGTYIHAKSRRGAAATLAVVLASLLLLYVGFMLVSNILLMMQPEAWGAHFAHRGGTLLPLSDPTLIPRYLHYVVASVAVAGLFLSLVWTIRKGHGIEGADAGIRRGLNVFGYATVVQAAVGLWFLIALRRDFLLQFMGGDPLATAMLGLGFLSGLGAIATALGGKFRPTLVMALVTLVAMVITRDQLRSMYLQGSFDADALTVQPQYGVLALFLVVLAAGVASVIWMIRAGFHTGTGRVPS